mgnify:CR=1 FL=1
MTTFARSPSTEDISEDFNCNDKKCKKMLLFIVLALFCNGATNVASIYMNLAKTGKIPISNDLPQPYCAAVATFSYCNFAKYKVFIIPELTTPVRPAYSFAYINFCLYLSTITQKQNESALSQSGYNLKVNLKQNSCRFTNDLGDKLSTIDCGHLLLVGQSICS